MFLPWDRASAQVTIAHLTRARCHPEDTYIMPWHPLTPALGLPFVSSSGSSPQEGLCDPAPPVCLGACLGVPSAGAELFAGAISSEQLILQGPFHSAVCCLVVCLPHAAPALSHCVLHRAHQCPRSHIAWQPCVPHSFPVKAAQAGWHQPLLWVFFPPFLHLQSCQKAECWLKRSQIHVPSTRNMSSFI